MAISKRTRYEVLRRDAFTCRYCGSSAPDVKLHVDHVTPVALGGTDEPSNLVAACVDCNLGKASTSPDDELVADVAEDAAEWAEARAKALERVNAERARLSDEFATFYADWCTWDKDASYLPGNAEATFINWRGDGLTLADVIDAHTIALSARHVSVYRVWRYMCGVLRNRLNEIQARTAEFAGGE